MRVLLFANDLMPFAGLPTSGGGLRCYQLMSSLESHGIEVIASMPGFTYLAEKFADKIQPAQKKLLWKYETQDDILAEVRPDAVIFSSNWDHYNLTRKPKVPLIIDLHGSRLVETSMWGNPISSERKVRVFSQADCMLCAGQVQRLYFYGWLVQAGRVPEDEHFIRYIPISLPQNKPLSLLDTIGARWVDELNDEAEAYPRIVSGGGWFPWQNQTKALEAVSQKVLNSACGRLDIYGSPHEKQGNTAEEEQIWSTYRHMSAVASKNSRIGLHDYLSREELLGVYGKSHVALELMEYNLERELAFTTRTIEYLWCGLPVIYNNYAELSSHIKEFDAGWTVDPLDTAALEGVMEEIFTKPQLVKQKSENALRLAQQRFANEITVKPLLDFLNSPVVHQASDPVLGSVHARPPFMNPRGQLLELSVGREVTSISQSFVVPAENVSSVELSFGRQAGPQLEGHLKYVELSLRRTSGRSYLSRKRWTPQAFPASGKLSIAFPFFRQPQGGEIVEFRVRFFWSSSSPAPMDSCPVVMLALAKPTYPLFGSFCHNRPFDVGNRDGEDKGQLKGRTASGNQVVATALALSFVPAEESLTYQLKVLSKRAVVLLREGKWKRIFRALRRRVPRLVEMAQEKYAQRKSREQRANGACK